MASSLSQLTGGGSSAAPGGVPAISLDGAMGQVHTGGLDLILWGILVVVLLYALVAGRGTSGGGRSGLRRDPQIRRGKGETDLAALRRARMASPDPESDPYS